MHDPGMYSFHLPHYVTTSQLRRFQGFKLRSFGVLGQYHTHWAPAHILLWDRLLSLFSTAYHRLAGLQASVGFPVSTFHLKVESLELWMHTVVPTFMWVLGIWTQAFMLVWQVLYLLSHLPYDRDAYNSLINFTSRHDMADALHGPTVAVIICLHKTCTRLGHHHSFMDEGRSSQVPPFPELGS